MLMLKGVGGQFVLEGGFIERDIGSLSFGISTTKNLGILHFGTSLSRDLGSLGFGVSLVRGLGYATDITLV
ncbi:hypothetical protein [Thermococcus barophilus]|uniref:Uncharacterized protein n=1 Tax=Thermococcus barophilus TaxID=55802 RepID=A0A0S1XF87_THEBA|nr:hypothetical protein [Thermococcus barophilus]ALM76461.1 hypothetical protein TBCH5v1_2572 [Thermococcus barophilus]